jgi:hypothetical protein
VAFGEVETGTQTATAAHDLGSGSAADGVYVCKFNLDDMVNGDVLKIGIKGGTLSGDANQQEYIGHYANEDGGLSDPNVTTPPVVITQGTARCFCEEVGANSISVPWALIQVQ